MATEASTVASKEIVTAEEFTKRFFSQGHLLFPVLLADVLARDDAIRRETAKQVFSALLPLVKNKGQYICKPSLLGVANEFGLTLADLTGEIV